MKEMFNMISQPGQILDMSMIFRRAYTVSTTCPWCSSQTNPILDHRDIQWYVIATLIEKSTNRCHSQTCSGNYRLTEEVHDVVSREDVGPQRDLNKRPRKEAEVAGPLPLTQQHDETGDIHLYTRVQILGVTFRINQRAPSNHSSTRLIIVGHRDLEDRYRLAQQLAEYLHLSEDDCRAAISEYKTQPIPSAGGNGTDSRNISITTAGSFRQDSTDTVKVKTGGKKHQTRQEIVWYCSLCHDGPYPNWKEICDMCSNGRKFGSRTEVIYYKTMGDLIL
jgi:hypothetical protein